MGLFGPSKKGGGLDLRFKSNKGGMVGKISNVLGDAAFGIADGIGNTLKDSSKKGKGIGNDEDEDEKYEREVQAEIDAEERELKEKKDRINKIIEGTIFDNDDPKDISLKLDNLISQARIGIGLGMPLYLFSAKIRTGLTKLNMIGAYEMSVHFDKEFKLLKRIVFFKLAVKILIGIAVILLLWWFISNL